MKFYFLIVLFLHAQAFAKVPTQALGHYHIDSYKEDGMAIEMLDYGALWDNSFEVNYRTQSYDFSYHRADEGQKLSSVDTLGYYEASYYGFTADQFEILKNDIQTQNLKTTINSEIKFGNCKRPTFTEITFNETYTKIKIFSKMQLCNKRIIIRELEMHR